MIESMQILAQVEIDQRLVGFLILIAIWIIGGIASWINKRMQQQRRQQDEMARRRAPQQARRRDEVIILEPDRPRRPVPQRPAPQRPAPQRPVPPPQRRPAPPQRPRATGPPPPIPSRPPTRQSQLPTVQRRGPAPVVRQRPAAVEKDVILLESRALGEAAAMQLQVARPMQERGEEGPAAVSAVAISRWLTPQTLRKQYILTEIFQPPVALRDREPGMPMM